MNVDTLYETFSVDRYTKSELESLGVRLAQQVLTHIGMIRYNKVKIKTFDFNPQEIGRLTDLAHRLLNGVNIYHGIDDYRNTIMEYIQTIREYKVSRNVKDSVKLTMKKSVASELRRFTSTTLDFEEIWDV